MNKKDKAVKKKKSLIELGFNRELKAAKREYITSKSIKEQGNRIIDYLKNLEIEY